MTPIVGQESCNGIHGVGQHEVLQKFTWLLFKVLPSLCFWLGFSSALDNSCSGYAASNVVQSATGLTADLHWAGTPCNKYGYDLGSLKLQVEYQTDARLHVMINDEADQVYQVPASVFPRPSSGGSSADSSALQFSYIANPFSFAVQRRGGGETIFNTSGSPLIFESQYLGLRTSLPANPNLYGLGEHSDPFKLGTTDYTRTLWSRDAYGIPPGTNLYGNHPVYFENRGNNQAHGVFLLNSDGMDIKINNDASGQYLEYNTIGGVIDLYFMAGPGPLDVARQYSEVVGKPAMMPYWGLGFHQCHYGYQDVYEVAGVVANYSAANIPLETMWTDIDYMDARKIFSLDPQRFPLAKVRELVDYLHSHSQHYIVMVDPAVAYQNYSAFTNGADQGVFLKLANGSIYEGVVWPGVTAFPDWFNPNAQAYWNGEFDSFFSADTGVDIDALWIDMNEASNFCTYPCNDPEGFARANGFPPPPPPVRDYSPIPLPGFPADFQPPGSSSHTKRQNTNGMLGLPNRDLLNPPYQIQNAAGSLSNKTLNTTLIHAGAGYAEYDTHNLYGTMMSSASRAAMLTRRPSLKPMVITRSTFAGAGRDVGKWLGDNAATWADYRISMAGQLGFASIYQVPMVGSDVCGYGMNTTENLCARWAMLGAFSPFYRNHYEAGKLPQEFYRFPTVAAAARTAIDIRYRMLDYLYTAMYQQTQDGTPLLNPLWFLYPNDAGTYGIDLQFFFGSGLLVSPVTDQDATSVSIYVPNDQFYDFYTFTPVRGTGANIQLNNIPFTSIPLHIRGGTIIPLRSQSANTTTALRNNDFNILVAPGLDGSATGSLYLDDGVSLTQSSTSEISFKWDGSNFAMSGNFGYAVGSVRVADVIILGMKSAPGSVSVGGSQLSGNAVSFNQTSGALTAAVNASLTGGFTMSVK